MLILASWPFPIFPGPNILFYLFIYYLITDKQLGLSFFRGNKPKNCVHHFDYIIDLMDYFPFLFSLLTLSSLPPQALSRQS